MVPGNSLGLVGISVDVASSLTSLAAKESIEVGASLVFASSLYSVTLSTALDEQL